jgi:hypothetical protein
VAGTEVFMFLPGRIRPLHGWAGWETRWPHRVGNLCLIRVVIVLFAREALTLLSLPGIRG